jgi:hypothetical protein
VRESGVTVSFLVVRGLDPEAMVVMDTGTPRTFADTLKIAHTARTSQVGAVVRRVWTWKRGNYMGKGGQVQPTRTELMQAYRAEMSAFDTAAQRGKDVANQKLGNGTAAGTAFYLFSEIDRDAAHSFVDAVLSGANLTSDHPALTLSRKLARREWDTSEQLAGWIRAWNAYRVDATLSVIVLVSRGELTNANFPQPK